MLLRFPLDVITDSESDARSVIDLAGVQTIIIRKAFAGIAFHELTALGGRGDSILDKTLTTKFRRKMLARADLEDLSQFSLEELALEEASLVLTDIVPSSGVDVEVDGFIAEDLRVKVVVHTVRDHHDDVVLIADHRVESHVAQIRSSSLDKGPETTTWVLGIRDSNTVSSGHVQDLFGPAVVMKDFAVSH